jgi:hypothetical protein
LFDKSASLLYVVTMNGKYVAYYRVSTSKQGINGLGMDAQKEAINRYDMACFKAQI